MLYNTGEHLDTPYVEGERLHSIYKDGMCMYPAGIDVDMNSAILKHSEFVSLTNCTKILQSNNPPPEGTEYVDITRNLPHFEEYPISAGIDLDYDITKLDYYDASKTYEIGDTVIVWDANYSGGIQISNTKIYTCVVNINEPESFNLAHWILGLFPKILGEYNPNIIYKVGDIISNSSHVYTCVFDIISPEAWNSSHWTSGYYPYISIYSDSVQYNIGDTVYETHNHNIHTCIQPNTGISTSNSSYWKLGYYPALIPYDSTTTYKLGDVVCYSDRLYTYVNGLSARGVPITRNDYWVRGYASGITDAMPQDTTGVGTTVCLYPYYAGSAICGIVSEQIYGVFVVTHQWLPYIYRDAHLYVKYPIYTWTSGDTQYIYSESSNIVVDAKPFRFIDSSNTLSDISALLNWDTHITYSLHQMFTGYRSLSDLSPISDWDVSNVRYMTRTFYQCSSLIDLQALKKWKLYSLIYLDSAFYDCLNLTSLSGAEEWFPSNLVSMAYSFYNCSSLSDISALSNWNSYNVTNLNHAFYNTAISDLSALSNWNTSKVTDMDYAFNSCSNITEISDLHWDMKNVIQLANTFCNLTSLIEIRELYFTNMSIAFRFVGATSLIKADFSRCTLRSDISGMDTGPDLFMDCPNLEVCDLGILFTQMSMRSLASSEGPFTDCTKLRLLIIRNTTQVLRRAFYSTYRDGLDNLVNNNGKIYVPQILLADYLTNPDYIDLTSRGVEILPLEGSPYEQPGSL